MIHARRAPGAGVSLQQNLAFAMETMCAGPRRKRTTTQRFQEGKGKKNAGDFLHDGSAVERSGEGERRPSKKEREHKSPEGVFACELP